MPRRPIRIPRLPETVVETPAAFEACLAHLADHSVIAFDTEFVGEFTYRPELCLVQVATSEHLYVIDPYTVGPLDRFWELLTDSKRQTIVHAGREEIRMCRVGIGLTPAHLIDLQPAAGLCGLIYPIGYAALVQTVLGHKVSKQQTLTDWRRRPLTDSQIQYAFDDVRYLIPAWKRILATLDKHQRRSWAIEEFSHVIRRSTDDHDPTVEKWRKIKGISNLDRKSLAVAKNVIAWRDQLADATNRPARGIIRDDMVLELSKRPPRSVAELSQLRGLPRNELDVIFHAIRDAVNSSPASWPEESEREFDPPNVAVLTQLLTVVMNDWATKQRISPSIVATQSDLKALIRRAVAGEEFDETLTLAQGWRGTHALPVLRSVLSGRTAIRVADLNSLNPLGVAKLGEV